MNPLLQGHGRKLLAVIALLPVSLSTVLAQIPPAFSTQPRSVSTNTGATVTFSVVAVGTEPLAFQWQKNGIPLAGETRAWLTLPSVQGIDSANYQVALTNTFGSTNSAIANLTVFVTNPNLLSVSTNPVSQYVLRGTNVSLSVLASGDSPLSYQWYYATTTTHTPLANETNSCVTLSNLLTSRSVWVAISNAHGITHSASARVEVRTNLASLGLPAHPLSATGWNADVVAENSLPTSLTPGGFDGFNWAWKEEGFMADYPALFNRAGLPPDGIIRSLADTNVVFRLQPYTTSNALILSAANGWTHDLVVSPPVRLHTLAVLGAASNPGSSSVRLIFADGTSTTNLNLAFPDWFDGTTLGGRLVRRPAIAALGRVDAWKPGNVLPDSYWVDMTGFSLHHADVDLRALGLTHKFLDRLRFTGSASSSLGIMALSGSVLETMAPPVLGIALNPDLPQITLYWSSLTTNWVLQQTSALAASTAWTVVTNQPTVNQATNYSLSLPLPPGERFYRVGFP